MGDRANIHIRENSEDVGVFLYSHWGGTELPEDLQRALAKKWRWNDTQYLTRIIFDVMTEERHGQETGYGISAWVGDGDRRVLVVNCDTQTVSYDGKTWTFEEYIKLAPKEINAVWD